MPAGLAGTGLRGRTWVLCGVTGKGVSGVLGGCNGEGVIRVGDIDPIWSPSMSTFVTKPAQLYTGYPAALKRLFVQRNQLPGCAYIASYTYPPGM